MLKHSLEPGLATEYGYLEAFILGYIEHWVKAAEFRKSEEKFHDGRYWTYASTRELARIFTYASRNSIMRALNHLLREELILKGNFNKMSWDQTAWYSLSDKYYLELERCAKKYEDMLRRARVVQNEPGVVQNEPRVVQNEPRVVQNEPGVVQNEPTIPIQSTYSIPYKGDNKQTQSAKQVNEEADSRFPGTKYDQETYGKAMDAYSKYIGYPVEASSTEIVCGMVDDYGLEPVLYGFKTAYKNKVRNLSYVESCARNYDPDARKKPIRRRHKNDVAASVAEAQRILAEQEARAEADGSHEEEGAVDFAKLLGF